MDVLNDCLSACVAVWCGIHTVVFGFMVRCRWIGVVWCLMLDGGGGGGVGVRLYGL